MVQRSLNRLKMAKYYVIQVSPGKEKEVIDLIHNIVPSGYYEDAFFVSKIRKKKYEGKWHDIEEKCFPGYIFIASDMPSEFAKSLRNIHQFFRFLGMDIEKQYFQPISDNEKIFIDSLMNKSDESGKKIIPLSDIEILEDNKIRILTGPLYGYEARIIKADFHKRKVIIEVNMCGSMVRTELGINIR